MRNTTSNPVTSDLLAGIPTAAATLRAMAARHGSVPAEVGKVDEAAAVLAAEVWCHALGAGTFAYPIAHGEEAVKSLAAILARVSGHGKEPAFEGEVHRDLDQFKTWEIITREYPEHLIARIASAAVHDLMVGGDARLCRMVTRR